MRRYVIKRLLLGIVTLIGVSIIVFTVSRLSGDVALLLAPQNATEEQLQIIRESLGLDKPIPVQYFIFVKNALHGDFGESITYQQPAMRILISRIPATLQLGITAFILGNFLGVFFGIVSATKRGSWLDWGGKSFALLGQAVPNFWMAVMLILLFAVELKWLPTSGMGGLKHMILPVISLSWFSMAFTMRITRSSMLDVLDTEYIKLARIKGNPERVVIWKHALRNALIPVVTVAGMQLAVLLGGSVFIETIFRWPGVGLLMVSSITVRDYSLVQAITLVITAAIVLINLLVDLAFVFLDPRIKLE
jgi:peptide/nickel transport system permease protein